MTEPVTKAQSMHKALRDTLLPRLILGQLRLQHEPKHIEGAIA